jgi:predicted RNase H-like HicB family nuclease
MQYTKIFQKSDDWWLGWVKEIPGSNTQGRTRQEVEGNLEEALELVLESYERL